MAKVNDIKIGQLAKDAGVNIQTVRYYERIGILKPTHRRESGYRIYDRNAARIIRFIKHAQELGFSLEEIQALLRLKSTSNAKCESVQKKARLHLEDVTAKISHLERIKHVLENLIDRCQHRKTDSECPILDALDGE